MGPVDRPPENRLEPLVKDGFLGPEPMYTEPGSLRFGPEGGDDSQLYYRWGSAGLWIAFFRTCRPFQISENIILQFRDHQVSSQFFLILEGRILLIVIYSEII